MTAPDNIRTATRQAYTDREGYGTSDAFDAAADAAYAATLTAAYWKLRKHAESYRNAKGVRLARERWEANRDDQRLYTKAVIHEFYARGVEEAARDIAELLGVPEHEIERPEEPA